MKKSVAFIFIVLCVVSIFFAGCTSSAGDNSGSVSVTPTDSQNKFSSGDILATSSSSTTGVAVNSYDGTTDSYQIYDVIKNADGSWVASPNPSQRSLSRTAVEKIYPQIVGKINGSTSPQNMVQSSSSSDQNNVQPSYTAIATSSSGVQIRITYSGAWSGSYGDAGSMQSVDGSGSKIITLDSPNSVVSTSFQKQDGSQNELDVDILKDGNVLKSGSTSAAYGVVAVAAMLNGESSSSVNPVSSKTVQVKVYYDGQWQGSYGSAGSIQSVDGSGTQSYTITNPNYMVSATFQKKDGSTSELRVEISEDGNVIKSGSTTAAYGLVLLTSQL